MTTKRMTTLVGEYPVHVLWSAAQKNKTERAVKGFLSEYYILSQEENSPFVCLIFFLLIDFYVVRDCVIGVQGIALVFLS